jgi:tetratricopeptide (TPR) repeat protein
MAAAISKLPACIICIEPYDEGTHTPRVSRCGHTFCDLCIRTLQKGKKKCPACRRQIGENKLPANFSLLELIREAPKRVVESQNQLIEKEIDDAYDEIESENYKTAEKRFKSVMRQAEATVEQRACARVGLGRLYRNVEKYRDAVRILEETLQLEGIGEEASKAHLELGIVFRLMNCHRKALDHLNPLIEDPTDPSYWEAIYNRGLLYKAMGKLEQGIADLKAHLNDPKPDEACIQRAKLELGRAHYLLKDYGSAVAILSSLKDSLDISRRTAALNLLATIEREQSIRPSTCCLIS